MWPGVEVCGDYKAKLPTAANQCQNFDNSQIQLDYLLCKGGMCLLPDIIGLWMSCNGWCQIETAGLSLCDVVPEFGTFPLGDQACPGLSLYRICRLLRLAQLLLLDTNTILYSHIKHTVYVRMAGFHL